jgi:hypothetical protein
MIGDINMTTLDKINEMTTTVALDLENAREKYFEAEATLVQIIGGWVYEAKVSCVTLGKGTIIETEGTTLDNIIVTIDFNGNNKRFSLVHIMNHKFVKFTDLDVADIWTKACTMHTEWTAEYKELTRAAKQLAIEAEKKAIAEKKAEEKYQHLKDKALRDFDELTNKARVRSDADEFYYALGWLANHVGAMTAILPDYLGAAFEKYFGIDTPKTLVDSRAKTSGGYAKQWSWEFKCTIKKLKDTVVPACIQNVTTDFAKGIHNTSFLWDLVANYGFQFGKKQDVNKIAQTIPAQYIDSFNEGLTA